MSQLHPNSSHKIPATKILTSWDEKLHEFEEERKIVTDSPTRKAQNTQQQESTYMPQ